MTIQKTPANPDLSVIEKPRTVRGVTFHDLRGTAVTRLALEAEIASITAHSLRDVHAILDAHYLARDPALGENAIRKLEKGTKAPNWSTMFWSRCR